MIIQNVHYTLNKNSRYFFQLLPGCWTGVLTVRLVKLSLLNLTAKNFCKTFFENAIKNKQWNRSTTNDFHTVYHPLITINFSFWNSTQIVLYIWRQSLSKKKTVTYASVWLMSEKLETAMKHFIEEFIWLTFFFLKIGHILFHYVNKLLRLTWGTYFIGSLPTFFPLSLNLPPRNEACVHT